MKKKMVPLVRLVIECTEEERAYIRMIASHRLMRISEYVIESMRPDIEKMALSNGKILKD